jgi:hypothetical protein
LITLVNYLYAAPFAVEYATISFPVIFHIIYVPLRFMCWCAASVPSEVCEIVRVAM